VSAVFEGPVSQVAGNDIHNHYAEPPGPDDDAEHVRDCPQCKRRTWAFTQHCHFCRMDLWLYDRKVKSMAFKRRVAWVMIIIALAYLYQPGPVFAARVDKAGATDLVREMDSVSYSLYNAVKTPEATAAMAKKIRGLDLKSQRLFGNPILGQPFAACASAVSQASLLWGEYRGLSLGIKAATPETVSLLARAGIHFGDAYRQCKTEVEALP
jgi:hypothetical protein